MNSNLIYITGTERASAAVLWANEKFSKGAWEVRAEPAIFSSVYTFKFQSVEDATYFALKWS